MKINIDGIYSTTNSPKCMSIQDLQKATLQDDHLQQLKDCIMRGWPQGKNKIPQKVRPYWTSESMCQQKWAL